MNRDSEHVGWKWLGRVSDALTLTTVRRATVHARYFESWEAPL